MIEIASLYTDGGLLSRAHSKDGGTWAWRQVSPAGAVIGSARGIVIPSDLGMDTVENNLTETLAVLYGLESLPDGWAGTLYTDNKNALNRATGMSKKFGGVPDFIKDRVLAVRKRLGNFTAILLGGHPSKKDLANGKRAKDGMPVSIHNVGCDRACQEMADEFWAGKKKTAQEPVTIS